jgi:SAM-dependent methyltransferase
LSVSHWENYYRGGAVAACPAGPDGNYTLELRDIWVEFFSGLASGARVLDIGTGNGAITLIARRTAEGLGRSLEIHGADLARINPGRDVQGGAQLFAGITFHPNVPAENLPFEAASFDAVSGQYALEYTDTEQSLAQVMRVLKPGRDAQFVMHHASSILVERAQASLRQSDIVLKDTKIYRKLGRFLEIDSRATVAAKRAWEQLSAAVSVLREARRTDADRRVIDVTLDAVPKLLELRGRLAPAALAREIESVEGDLRHTVRRLNDLITVAVTETAMAECARRAGAHGFIDVAYQPLLHAQRALVGWQFRLRKP